MLTFEGLLIGFLPLFSGFIGTSLNGPIKLVVLDPKQFQALPDLTVNLSILKVDPYQPVNGLGPPVTSVRRPRWL